MAERSPSSNSMDTDSPKDHHPMNSSPAQTTPTPPHSAKSSNGTASKSSTPPVRPQKKSNTIEPQLIGDLPVSRKDALATFNQIPDNNYQYKTLGRSRELLESMTCDCTYDHGIDAEDKACGPSSDCINRLTQVECLPDDCKCRNYCRNQRFQHKQYANIEIVLTEKKGFGLRAEEDLPKDTFIYEYVGDVVNPVSFKKRMRDYAQEGIQHFYFMMLQKDEFIDATKSGGIGRFANHSCNPNCYVAKWTIGDKVRMGIFAKRLIRKYEELTFNYNVDRYGHQAQICYCGEPNCVGYIGGKTQTDFAAMDELYLDALGITDEDELMELKGTKKKKGKKIDDPDFMPNLKPVVEKDIPKVVQAIRQTTSRKMLYKIFTRIKLTDDQAALRQLMRLRGYSLMTNVLKDYKEDSDLILLALQCMDEWPLMNKNKVEDSQIYIPVEEFMNSEDDRIRPLAQKLYEHWNTLPTYNRIPKRLISAVDDSDPLPNKEEENDDDDEFTRREKEIKRARRMEEQATARRVQQRVHAVAAIQRAPPTTTTKGPDLNDPQVRHRKQLEEQQKIQAIITFAAEAKAAEEAAAEAKAAEAAEKKAKEELASNNAAAKKKEKEKERAKAKKLTPEEKAVKEAKKEKRLVKLVGEIVVKCMSKHSKELGKESFKKYAKELTHLIADKEKKSAHYKENRYDTLPEAKTSKIKRYCKEYMEKLLVKLEKSGKLNKHHSSSSAASRSTESTMTKMNGNGNSNGTTNGTTNGTPSTSITTPNSADGGPHNGYGYGDDQDGEEMSMAMEVGMDMDMDMDLDLDDDDDDNNMGGYSPRREDMYDAHEDHRSRSRRGEDEYGRRGDDEYGRRGDDEYRRRGDDEYERRGEDEYGRRRDRDSSYNHGDIGDPRKRQKTNVNDDRIRHRSRLPQPPPPPPFTSSSSLPSRWRNPHERQ